MKVGNHVGFAAEILRKGGLVSIPTETVYGLAADATNPDAVAAIFKVKKRPSFDPLIIHVSDFESAKKYTSHIDPRAKLLADHFWPGPLTLVLPKKDSIPDIVSAGLTTVGVRVPNHPITLDLLRSVDFPLAAPSANLFGYVSPTRPQHVASQLGESIDYILDGGPCAIGVESTILGFENDSPVIYRRGGIEISAIEDLIGPVKVNEHSNSNPQAPGMLSSHYSPFKKLVGEPYDQTVKAFPNLKVGALRFSNKLPSCPENWQLVLSESGNLLEAAYHLFEYLRKIDELEPDLFVVEFVPDIGIGQAINDRLRRATASNH